MPKINEKMLQKSAEHVVYEINMFKASSEYLARLGERDVVMHNALFESFAIHTRTLFDFFYTEERKKYKDDVLALDFLENRKVYKSTRTPKKELSYIVKRANKQIAHITYHRNKYNKKSKKWPTYKTVIKFEKTINAFLNNLPPDRREWFREVL